MKKFAILLVIVCIVSFPFVRAEEGYVFDSGMIVGVEGALARAEELVIPEKINGHAVEIVYRIESENVKKVILPSSVRVICRNAFSGCPALEEINLDNVQMIYGNAFEGCVVLKRISEEEGNKLPKECIIGNEAFKGCGIEEVSIEKNIGFEEGYGEKVFKECFDLGNICIGAEVTQLGDYAFEGCSALEVVSIPRNIDRVCDGVFKSCTGLRTVIFPAKNVAIYSRKGYDDVFEGCEKLTIMGMAGSTAEAYAREHGIRFIPSIITEREKSEIIGYAECSEIVAVNGVKIPAYNINGSIYIGENALKCMGFEFKWNKSQRKTEVYVPEGVSWEIDPSGNPNPYGLCFFSTDVSFVYGGRVIPAINVGNGESIVDVNALAGKKLY